MGSACVVCGKGQEDRPMCWRGMAVCSEACRKRQGEGGAAVPAEPTPQPIAPSECAA